MRSHDGHTIVGEFKEDHESFTPEHGPQIYDTTRQEVYASPLFGGSVVD